MAAPTFDPRLTPARPDLAAASLRGRIDAPRFVEGHRCQVTADVLDVKRRPRPDAPVDTQLLFGETVVVFDEDEGWSWVQAERDAYVGYVTTNALSRTLEAATHRVIVNRTFVYPAANMKLPVIVALPLDAHVTVDASGSAVADPLFRKLSTGGFIVASHIAPLAQSVADYVTVAEQLIGAPYLWGGKSVGGIDCSGLVQLAMSVTNRSMPRDTDLQETSDQAVKVDPETTELLRGDLVFWKGHVGIMSSATDLLHANGYHMLVTREPLVAAQARIEATTHVQISAIRRPNTLI